MERGVLQRTRKEGWRTVAEGLRRDIPDHQVLEYEDGEEDDRTRPPPRREAVPFDFHYTQTVKTELPDIQRQRAESCPEEIGPADLSCSRMERWMEAPREGVGVWWLSVEGRRSRGSPSRPKGTAAPSLFQYNEYSP